jgi:hypothetical protein
MLRIIRAWKGISSISSGKAKHGLIEVAGIVAKKRMTREIRDLLLRSCTCGILDKLLKGVCSQIESVYPLEHRTGPIEILRTNALTVFRALPHERDSREASARAILKFGQLPRRPKCKASRSGHGQPVAASPQKRFTGRMPASGFPPEAHHPVERNIHDETAWPRNPSLTPSPQPARAAPDVPRVRAPGRFLPGGFARQSRILATLPEAHHLYLWSLQPWPLSESHRSPGGTPGCS